MRVIAVLVFISKIGGIFSGVRTIDIFNKNCLLKMVKIYIRMNSSSEV